VRVFNDRTDTQSLLNMTKVTSGVILENDPGPYDFWEVSLPASPDPTVYWYRFIVKDGTQTAFYEDDSNRTGGWGQAFNATEDNSYQLSIYDPAFSTPDWVKNAVIYQIFPDRFRDGESANNPAAGEFFYGSNDTIFRSNQTAWNTPICDPRDVAGAAAGCENAYSQNFYGGDLQGITEKITDGYFSQLGVSVLYLNPIFKSPSNHKYDTTDYGKIDPHFGTLADFEALVDAANAADMHIILDGVFNHVSSDSPYLDRYSRYPEVGACESKDSPYRDWFYFTPADPAGSGPCVGDDGTPGGADYESWWGYDSLPKLRANTPQVRELIWDSATPSTTKGIARYWIDEGASGWRLDVGGDVDPGTINDPNNDYWEGFRNAVHASDPEGYIVGEEWGNAISWNLGGEWDATMNYQASAAILSFWRDTAFSDNDFNSGSSAGALTPITAEEINERLLNLQERYPPEAFAAMMNLFGSHDTNRALFLLNKDAGSNNTALYANPAYDWNDSITRLKGAALIQMTMPGAPTIYYGDEIGLVGPPSYDGSQWQDDPYNRQPYPWLETGLGSPYYEHLQDAGPGSVRANLLAYYQTLTSTRNSTPALRTGSLDPLWTANASPVYVYGRKMADDSSAAIIAANKDAAAQTVTINVAGYLPIGATLSDALSSATFTVAATGDLVLTNIPARGGYLLTLDAGFSGERPAAPSLTAASATSGKVSLAWDAVPGAASYDVYRSVLSSGAYELLANTAALTYEDTTAANGVKYYYVIKAKTVSLLESEFSNERSAIPAYVINWANLQSPFSTSPVRSLVTPSENIYGQVYIEDVTSEPGATPSLMAQVGYGNDGTLPTDAAWRWFDASFNGNVGNNDEFAGQMVVDAAPGDYDYVYRYSTDGGVSWVYGVHGGLIPSDLSSYNAGNAGEMTILADTLNTTAPDAPTNLALVGTTTSSISLKWDAHPNSEGDLYGFEVWRKDLPGATFTRIALLSDPAATNYTDTNVIADSQYQYYLLAIDEAVNASTASNTISATAEMRMVAVTFRVTVPNATPGTVYVAGGFSDPLPAWNPGGIPMSEMGGDIWQTTLSLLDGATIEYKYARGNWDKGEKGTNGNTEISNRSLTVAYGTSGTQTVNDTVANWRDPFVTAISPANEAVGVFPNVLISASWNQAMSNPVTPASCFTVSGPGGAVAGAISYNTEEMKYIFTPDSPLANGNHTVSISGCIDVGDDTQQVARLWSFTVESTPPSTFEKSAPANAASDQPLSPMLSWNASDGATSYEYCYSSAPGPCSAWHSVGTNTSVTLNDLAAGYTYYWQVRAVNPDGTTEANGGTWWSFSTTDTSACTWPAYTAPASATFGDVPMSAGHWSWVERLSNATITAGCGAGNFCPFNDVNRAQMAIFLLRAKHCGSSYTPPAIVGSPHFNDVPVAASYAAWVEQLALEGITTGCGGGNFCPLQNVNRAEMAIFALRARHGATYSPPAVGASTGFGDVPVTASYAPWVVQLAAEGISSGCGGGNFCPMQSVNRAQMSIFLVRAFELP
jgi:glycosidase